MSSQEKRVFDIERPQLAGAVDILCQAFAQYPVMGYFFDAEGPNRPSCMRRMFEISCEARLALGWPLIGCEVDGVLLGAAYGTPPDGGPWPPELMSQEEAFHRGLDGISRRNMSHYGQFLHQHAPSTPHYYLHAIGVLPESQGLGVGRALVDQFQHLSRAHPTSQGVALDTEIESNVAFYERCGYGLTHHGNLDDMKVWFLYRAD